jgi:hypothetical protein
MTTHDNSARRPRSRARAHSHSATATTHPAELAPSAQPVALAQPPLFSDTAQPPAVEADAPISAHEAPRPGRSSRGSRRTARSAATTADVHADAMLVAPPASRLRSSPVSPPQMAVRASGSIPSATVSPGSRAPGSWPASPHGP